MPWCQGVKMVFRRSLSPPVAQARSQPVGIDREAFDRFSFRPTVGKRTCSWDVSRVANRRYVITFESSTSRRHWTCTCGCASNAPSCRNFDWRCADKSGTWSAPCASPCAVSTTSDAWNPSNKFYSETTIQCPWTDRSHRPRRGPRLQDRRYHPRPLRYLLLVLQINTNTQDHLYINHKHATPYAQHRKITGVFFPRRESSSTPRALVARPCAKLRVQRLRSTVYELFSRDTRHCSLKSR